METITFGNHCSVIVPTQDREKITTFYCDVLGGTLAKAEPERDFVRLGDDFYIVFLYGDVPDASEFMRTARAPWFEIKSSNVEETNRRIRESGLALELEVPDAHLYFQAPGGQCMRVVGIDEDLSAYEGTSQGSDLKKWKKKLVEA